MLTMDSVFRIEIQELEDGYKVKADFNGRSEGARLGSFPEGFGNYLEPLQEEILAVSQALSSASPGKAQDAAKDALGNVLPSETQDEEESNGSSGPVLRGYQNWRRGADVKRIQEIGSELYSAIFRGKVYQLFDTAFAQAVKSRQEMPIKLCLEAPSLSHYPWETMFDSDRQKHISCVSWTPFSRTVGTGDADIPTDIKPPLRLLIMVASPKEDGLNWIDAPAEQAAIEDSLKSFVDAGLIRIGKTPSGTLSALRNMIEMGDDGQPWNVFHFIGHGVEGHIAMEGTGPKAEWVAADTLMYELDVPKGPQLVVLNSCKGALRLKGDRDRFSNTAETLVGGATQIIASIAMQFEVSDTMAARFSPLFYHHLLSTRCSLQRAMLYTRRDLRHQRFAEWISPVLYTRGPDVPFIASP
jgi:hypothetical protein